MNQGWRNSGEPVARAHLVRAVHRVHGRRDHPAHAAYPAARGGVVTAVTCPRDRRLLGGDHRVRAQPRPRRSEARPEARA
jgi:hypothetical protein